MAIKASGAYKNCKPYSGSSNDKQDGHHADSDAVSDSARFQCSYRRTGNSDSIRFLFHNSGMFYHLYNQSSYQALDDISPLTFSAGNTMKRVVVIVATVLFFRNPVKSLNALGLAIAIFGTFLYS